MSQVTYRGVSYDTVQRRQAQAQGEASPISTRSLSWHQVCKGGALMTAHHTERTATDSKAGAEGQASEASTIVNVRIAKCCV